MTLRPMNDARFPTMTRPDARPENERSGAVESIRQFRLQESLPVHFVAVAVNPYASDARTMEIYEDEDGYEYWIDPRDDRLVQTAPAARQPASPHQTRPEDRLPVAELRSLALQLIEKSVPGFGSRLSCYHPLEDNRNREIYFFRFDDFSAPIPESELPPFIQVGLRADGRLVSFTDTLILPDAEDDSNCPE